MGNGQLTNYEIRPAAREDVPVIYSFVCELAEYEKLSHAVVAAESDMDEALFGENPVAECIVMEYEGRSVGFALFFRSFSTFVGRPGIYLEDLYVQPEMRGKGMGRAMLTHLAKLAVERGCGRLEWSVLNWNESAIGFYKSLGAVPMDEWTVFRMTGESLERFAAE